MKYWLRLLVSLFLLIPEISVLALSEENYKEKMDQLIGPFVKERGVEGTVATKDGQTIAYQYFDHPEAKATIVILQGWTEHYGGGGEFAYDMYQKKVSTFFFDWRGQGRSSRPLEDTFRSHIEDYNDYFNDLSAYLDQVVQPRRKGPLVALAFSMGANILSLYETAKPKTFDRLILISPMLDMKTDPLPQWAVWIMCRTAELFGFGSSYIWGSGPFDGTTQNMSTSSEIRFDVWRKFRSTYPETVINGVSWSWMRASLEATWSMREQAEKLQVPIMMLQAGKDSFVRTGGQDYVCSHAETCLKIVFPQSMHAILAENDRIRGKAIREILDFIEYGF